MKSSIHYIIIYIYIYIYIYIFIYIYYRNWGVKSSWQTCIISVTLSQASSFRKQSVDLILTLPLGHESYAFLIDSDIIIFLLCSLDLE